MRLKTIIFLSFAIFNIVNARVGCMDNSWHLEKPVDDKSYHYVQCNCPCEKVYVQLEKQGICTKCQHFHDAQPLIIITAQDAQEIDCTNTEPNPYE